MAEAPGQSLPKRLPEWKDLKAAYRLLSNPAVSPGAIGQAHRRLTRERAEACDVVLSVQDTTSLDYTRRSAVRGLGRIGDGVGRGFQQHSALALDDRGEVLGLLYRHWFNRVDVPRGETRRQRQARWSEPDVWGDTAEAIGPWTGRGRLIHVGDRHSDVFRFLQTCRRLDHGFLVRAMHDRYLTEGTRLWAFLQAQAEGGRIAVSIKARRTRGNRLCRKAREATVALRWAKVSLPPPRNDPRTADAEPIVTWAIYATEVDPPAAAEPVEWMLLSSEPIKTPAAAKEAIRRYQHRWKIEEWHRALKEGCRIERSQLDDAADLQRLAALCGIVAVRMLQLRDQARSDSPAADDPEALRRTVPPLWITLVGRLRGWEPETLTPRQFFLGIAKQGGYLARKHDGPPGWIVLWRGWYDLQQMVHGAQLLRGPPPTCG